MPAPLCQPSDRLEPGPALGFLQMIMTKDNPAAAWQLPDRLLETRIIPFVGEQP